MISEAYLGNGLYRALFFSFCFINFGALIFHFAAHNG